MRRSKRPINVDDMTPFPLQISRRNARLTVSSAVLMASNILALSNVFAETLHRPLGRTYTIHLNYSSSYAPARYFGADEFTVALVGSKMVLTKSESKSLTQKSTAWRAA